MPSENTKTTLSPLSRQALNLTAAGGKVEYTEHGDPCSLFIPTEVPSSKNSQQIAFRAGKRKVIKSDFARNYDKVTAMIYRLAQPIFREMIVYEYPLHVGFQFIRRTNGIFDYCNLAQSVQDQMTRARWLPDDRMTYLIPLFLPYIKNKDNPGVWISIVDSEIFRGYGQAVD